MTSPPRSSARLSRGPFRLALPPRSPRALHRLPVPRRLSRQHRRRPLRPTLRRPPRLPRSVRRNQLLRRPLLRRPLLRRPPSRRRPPKRSLPRRRLRRRRRQSLHPSQRQRRDRPCPSAGPLSLPRGRRWGHQPRVRAPRLRLHPDPQFRVRPTLHSHPDPQARPVRPRLFRDALPSEGLLRARSRRRARRPRCRPSRRRAR
jgi:serine/arginine repetitive matrix protein 1